ncbi:MAG: hypothetical protein OXL34_17110 [Gemmatimonadota bacterium]|nr:hypothetical protein [Gemmatimonadota bacterium]
MSPRRPSPAARGPDPGFLHGLLALIGGATICLACTGAPDDPPQSEAGEWELVEDLRLDANAEDFSVVSWVYVGPQGEMVVPERQDYRVRVYDSAGTLMATIGRRGEGPGEFQAPAPVFWAADTLVVFDMLLGRATYLLPAGTPARTEAGRFFRLGLVAPDADSTFMAFTPEAVDDEGAKLGVAYLNFSTGGRREAQLVVLRVSRDGEPSVVATPPRWDDERWSVTISGLTNSVPFVFDPWPEIAPDGSRFLFATADQSTLHPTYNLTLVRPTHDTVFSRSYPYPGEPIPDSAMDRGIADMVPESDLARRFRAVARERAPVVYSPTAVTLGLDGTIWVELRRTDRGTPVHVLSETGDPIGSLLLPPRSRIRQASMTHVWVTEYDPLDLASVVRYRVIRHPGTGPGGELEE